MRAAYGSEAVFKLAHHIEALIVTEVVGAEVGHAEGFAIRNEWLQPQLKRTHCAVKINSPSVRAELQLS